MLRRPDRLEAALFEGAAELRRGHRVLGEEHRRADMHDRCSRSERLTTRVAWATAAVMPGCAPAGRKPRPETVLNFGDAVRCRRSQRFLPQRAGAGGPPDDPPRHSAGMAGSARGAPARDRLHDAVPLGLVGRHRTHRRADAGAARSAALAAGGPQSRDPGAGRRIALCRLLDRPRPAGPRAGNQRGGRTDAEGDLARPGRRRPAPDRRAQPPRHLGPARPHAVRLRPALHDVAAVAIIARRAVHPGRLGRGIVHSAGEGPDDHALGAGLGAHRQALVSDLCRRANGRSDQADLCQAGGDPRAAPPPRLYAGGSRVVVEGQRMKIKSVAAFWVHIPISPDRQHTSDFGRTLSFDGTLVRIDTECGLTGWAGPDKIGEELLGYIARGGFGAVKMRVGIIDGDPRHSARRVHAAREALGPEVGLMCDAHGTLSVAEARRFCRLVEDCNLAWFEEPVTADDKRGQAEVRAMTDIPIASGESEFTRHDFRDLAALAAVDIMQPDLAICGGITEAMRISALASAHNLKLAPHLWAGAPAFAAGLQVAAASPAGFIVEYSLGANPLLHDLVEEDFLVNDGMIEVPDRPGLGITVREDFLKQHTVAA